MDDFIAEYGFLLFYIILGASFIGILSKIYNVVLMMQ